MKPAIKVALLVGIVGLLVATVGLSILNLGDVKPLRMPQAFDERCRTRSDAIEWRGSCAPPLRASDFTEGRAALTLVRRATGDHAIEYTFENLTSRLRSLVWNRVEVVTPTGDRIQCRGDDSTQRYAARPFVGTTPGYGCLLAVTPGRYVALYDGLEVAYIDIAT